ncbi:hypothetical protein B2G71_17110 [Novosphingobium sp. PC22D]|uniref:hypothetical protein n=1 Tax=Novosphingobium sp. PC22D TaxID=1962403 RepID=UPI000BF18BAC|nr:hypothetical protein [Novosphingobium sp. PC22D]PEQ11545.1 hypothetical protein B2G71_17110 [Novosphingobium sp. PC22D]
MSRLIACLIALSAMLGLLGQSIASAHRIEAAAMPGCGHMAGVQRHAMDADGKQGPMHHAATASGPITDCDDCPPAGHHGKTCHDLGHCLTIASGSALLLPDTASLSPAPSVIAQQHRAVRTAELSGLAAPPMTEPPILSA